MSKTFKKLSVIKKTSNFREAVKVVSVPLVAPSDDQVLIKNIYAGVNATDVNTTASRYNPNAELPFDVGLEVSVHSMSILFLLTIIISYNYCKGSGCYRSSWQECNHS